MARTRRLKQTLCTLNTLGIQNTGYFGLYDAYSWWLANYDYSAIDLAWNGFFGLKSELPGSYNPGNDGAKPAWSTMTAGQGSNCPVSGAPVTPVIAVLPDGSVPSPGANPYYTVGDIANIYYTAANATSLSLNGSSNWNVYTCDPPNQQINGPQPAPIVGSCGYTPISLATTGTFSFTLNGSNTDVDGVSSSGTTPASPVTKYADVGTAPKLTGAVDFNNSNQGCNLTTNPGCMLTVSQLDTVEFFGAGFSPTGGNKIELLGGSGQQELNPMTTFTSGRLARADQRPDWMFCFTRRVDSVCADPNPGSAPSNSVSVTVTASSGCS